MSDTFIALNDRFFVAPQISLGDTTQAKDAGVTLIVNNRPDGESPGQPPRLRQMRALPMFTFPWMGGDYLWAIFPP